MKLERYVAGFRLIGPLNLKGVVYYPVNNGQAIVRGTMIGFSAGYAVPVTGLAAAKLAGIAVTDNTAGEASSSGAVNVGVIPMSTSHQFAVPVANNALITQAAVGTIIDLEAAGTVDISDTTLTPGWGFQVDDIDASAQAIAANAYGFAIGHFEYLAAS